MQEISVVALVRRIEEMERRARWQAIMTCLTLVAVVALVTMGFAKGHRTDEVVEAQKFVLRDAKGKIRGGFGVDPDDGVLHLALADKNEKIRADLSLTEKGRTGLFLLDEAATVRAGFSVLPDGRPDFGLTDDQGRVRIGVGFDEKSDVPAIVLYDVNGNRVWRVTDIRSME